MLCKIKPVLNLDEKSNRTLMFAAKELQKYLRIVCPDEIPVIAAGEGGSEDKVIYIGVDLCGSISIVEDKKLDDAIVINVENFTGVITGSNARSALIAVYRFLREKGYKFIRPGKDGETFPETVDGTRVYACEKASYRHRGICIEGGVFQENLADIMDWIPKVAMNEYFVQSKIPDDFLNRWYSGKNHYIADRRPTVEEVMAVLKDAEEEMQIRGIMYHAVGHGWIKSALGVERGEAYASEEIFTDHQKAMMAEINGVRDISYGSAHNTNLCYSQNEVREILIDDVVNYCEEHPEVDYLHFWLSDACNNHCECEGCRDTRPSDFYLMMLNAIDQKLTEKGINTKIVFLLYYDLLWKPLVEKFKNHNRFTLMFAPISRSYSKSYDPKEKGKMTEYIRNKLVWPSSVGDCLEYLRDWQKDFNGDSFVFDYHFIWDHHYEFPQYDQARVLSGDIKALEETGINGFMNCQLQRVFTPTSLGMNVLAETLWNREISFETVCENVLKTEFGGKWESVRDYLAKLSSLSAAKAIRGEEKFTDNLRERLTESKELISVFESENKKEFEGKYCKNWQRIKFFGELYSKTIDYIMVCGEENDKEALNKAMDFAFRNEYRFRDVFDATFYSETLEGMLTGRIRISKGLKEKE